MVTEGPQTSSVVRVPAEPVIEAELAVVAVPGVRVGLVAQEDPVAREVRAALAEQEDPVAREVRAALAEQEDPVAREVQEDLGVPAVRAALVVQENPAVPAARAASVVPENPVVLVGQEDPAALVVQEDPVAPVVLESPVVQELDREAVPGASRSAIAVHHRDQVVVAPRRVEDLAVAAETTREPAVIEAEKAWAAAV